VDLDFLGFKLFVIFVFRRNKMTFMDKKDLIIGFAIGVISTVVGTYLFLIWKTDFSTFNDLKMIKQEGILGKVMTLGAVLNIFVFFVLLQNKKELMARGVVLATIVLAIATMFL
jgi:hypothetical protein